MWKNYSNCVKPMSMAWLNLVLEAKCENEKLSELEEVEDIIAVREIRVKGTNSQHKYPFMCLLPPILQPT